MPTHYNPHLLSIAEFAEFFHLDPWHVHGFCTCEESDQVVANGCTCACTSKWREYATFDVNHISREAVSKAIAEAEQKLLDFLNFAVAPRAFVEQKIDYRDGAWLGRNFNYRIGVIQHKYVKAFGSVIDTLISTSLVTLALPIIYRNQMATVTVVVPSGTLAEEIHVYYTATDRFNQAKDQWEITPITVSISGVNATIQMPAYVLGQPDLTHLDPIVGCLDRDDPLSYVTEVEVYRRTLDTCDQGYGVGNERCPTPPCNPATQLVCFDLKKKDIGSVFVIPVNCTNNALTRDTCPSIASVSEVYANYVAGYPLESGRIAPALQAAVAYLSASLLTCKLPYCDCEPCYHKAIEMLKEIPKVKTGEGGVGIEGDTYKILLDDKLRPERYPLGLTWGAIKAYQQIYQYQL